ncbi:transglutaminase domain-containing protein [Novipirellula artificiosorum]|uniref:Transglutaminase-like superfamily protein n=1 Tax=Novipirellula artificiosorum TaxID=2528016 RepID=A0A5C6DPA3_9BACT|nr:transglutaminase domain-containing protein [Novipirellula artificiosorum]TWU38630.1 Transglutaminase-like superfamily protein [Novipirellula artificiosorum]
MTSFLRLIATITLALELHLAVLVASEPTVNSIDYSNPDAYTAISDTLGSAHAIAEQASALKGNDSRATIKNVLEWMDANLSYDGTKAYEWRNYDTVVEQGCYGGCADQAIVCGVLLQAAGVPTVWVKTMDVPWIWDLKKGRSFKSWSGHVFLEVYLDNQWVLLDPGAKQIYMHYSPESRILPGDRFAYHKGNDPQQMVMSLQWEQWKEQTNSYFSQLDDSMLPVDIKDVAFVGVDAYVIGNNPHYKTLSESARQRGWTVRRSFNSDYDNLLPLAQGQVLLIETQGGAPIVPLDVLERVYPGASKGLKASDGVVRVGSTTIAFVDCSTSDSGKPPQLPMFDQQR